MSELGLGNGDTFGELSLSETLSPSDTLRERERLTLLNLFYLKLKNLAERKKFPFGSGGVESV